MNNVAELTEAQRVVLLGPNDLPALWPQLEPLVVKACEYSMGQFNPEVVVDGILAGEYRLLAYMDGDTVASIALLCVSRYRIGLCILEVLLASGQNLRDWRKFEEQVAAYGKAQGCQKFRMIGREGLQRMLPEWRRAAIVLEKEFD